MDLKRELITYDCLGGRGSYGVWDEHVHMSVFKLVSNKDLLSSTWNSVQCYGAGWVGGGFGGEWIHVCKWLSPFAVPLKLSHC